MTHKRTLAPRVCGLGLAAVMLVSGTALAKSKTRAPASRPAGMVLVGPGTYRPLYPAAPEESSVPVARFWLDVLPVTNAEFLEFVRAIPDWRRDRVKVIFADSGYLSHWAAPDVLGSAVRPLQPVTRVSWFAAKAYCAARGARLPTEREWELAALASETAADGSSDPAWRERILAWYSEPAHAANLADVGRRKPNFWGIRDLHGLTWEWVSDFGASLVSADSREKDGSDKTKFCGASAANARDPADYAAFMRIAFRSSLEAWYTTARLGFRCARSVEVE
jgi:sulfatase modifying factor 1